MEFNGCSPFTRCSTTSLPARGQLIGQSDTATLFEHYCLEAAQQLYWNLQICRYDHTGHLF